MLFRSIASTITTIVVYLPLSVMNGLSGQMFSQLGYTIIVAMLASLISALTLIPLLFVTFKPREKKETWINHLLQKVAEGYDKILRKVLRHNKLSIAISIILLVVSF